MTASVRAYGATPENLRLLTAVRVTSAHGGALARRIFYADNARAVCTPTSDPDDLTTLQMAERLPVEGQLPGMLLHLRFLSQER